MLKLVVNQDWADVELYCMRYTNIARSIHRRLTRKYGIKAAFDMCEYVIINGGKADFAQGRDKELLQLYARLLGARLARGEPKLVHSVPMSKLDKLRHNMREYNRNQLRLHKKYTSDKEEII